MKKSFFAGLITLLPILITYIILALAIRLITGPYEYVGGVLLKKVPFLDQGFWIFTHEEIIQILSKLLIILLLIGLIFLIGFFASKISFHPIGHYIDKVLMKTPVVRSIYGPSKELVNVFFTPQEAQANRQAVLVPYPSAAELTVGIVTAEFTAKLKNKKKDYVSVFVPSTPNATGGYLCTFEKSHVTPLYLPADVALKSVMSFKVSKGPLEKKE